MIQPSLIEWLWRREQSLAMKAGNDMIFSRSPLIEAEIGSIVPLGRDDFPRDSGHFVPGYYQPVPPGQKPFTPRAPHVKLALIG